jgi:hypothetical protein
MKQEKEVKSYFGLKTEILIKMLNHHNLMYHIVGTNNKHGLINHDYIASKSKKFLIECNEKLSKASEILKENENNLVLNRVNLFKTAAVMYENEKKLVEYEKDLLHSPALSYYNEKQMLNFNNEIDVNNQNSLVDENCKKDFNELTVDELIYLYWHDDETSLQSYDTDYNSFEKDIEYMSLICKK